MSATGRERALRESCVWSLFFLISAGLGYPTLNRYDPRGALPDVAIYAKMAVERSSAVNTHLRFRVLVPYLARPVFKLVRNHSGSWDPLMFSFLVVNACFVATTAYLLFRMGLALLQPVSVALLGAGLYLLNFAIANVHLAALVDAGEACFLIAVVWSMFSGKWFLLPLWGLIGTLAKESFVPFSIAMLVAWWLASGNWNRRLAVWIGLTAAVELTTLVFLQSAISRHWVSPWSFGCSMQSPTGLGENLWHSIIDRNSWYILIWLLPLGLAGRKRLPQEWRAAAAAGIVLAILLNAYHSTVGGGGGGLGRYVFNIAGPLLGLSAAAFLAEWVGETCAEN